jgi:hypothetical protein
MLLIFLCQLCKLGGRRGRGRCRCKSLFAQPLIADGARVLDFDDRSVVAEWSEGSDCFKTEDGFCGSFLAELFVILFVEKAAFR